MSEESAVRLTLPEPPSANRWWRRAGNRMHLSNEARTYKADVGRLCTSMRVEPVTLPVVVMLTWYRGRKSGDLDKRIGVLLDALQGHVYECDSQIVALVARREDDKANPRVEVTIVCRGAESAITVIRTYLNNGKVE